MQKILLFLLCLLHIELSAQNEKSYSLEDIFSKSYFSSKNIAGFHSLNDGKYFVKTDERQNLLRFEFTSGNLIDTLLRRGDLILAGNSEPISMDEFSFSKDESKLLIASDVKSIYRHSFDALYYVYDFNKKSLTQPIKERVKLAEFSPDARFIAFVKNNDLYYFNLSLNKEERITSDGKINEIINGSTDWVYEEEFAIWKGFYWSPNSDAIAYYKMDESKVKEYSMPIYGNLYPENERFKYPKAGEANSVVKVLCYTLNSQQNIELNIGKEIDIYIPRIQWSPLYNSLFIQRLNRLQNQWDILSANPQNGQTKVIYTETNKYYIDIPDELYFTADAKNIIFESERDSRKHLYEMDLNGQIKKQITKGDFDIDVVYGIDKNNRLYYSSSEPGANRRNIYSISIQGKDKKCLSKKEGWNSASFNSDFTLFLNTYSNINTPPFFSIMDITGKEWRTLEDNARLTNRMKEFPSSNAVFTNYKNTNGTSLNAWVIKPLNFDSSKKYPVLMYAYNGPGHQLVVDRWMGGNYFWYQYLSQKGYFIICVDGRGTGFRGEEFKKCTYLNLGKNEINDQIDVAKYLGSLPYIDANRIGFWGWSYGGYMASLAITKGADVFKTAIAVAPVTNWRYYDNIYTERYMRKPSENGSNYDENSPIFHVNKIKGNYLIIHGTADDNVHFQNSADMVDAMIKNGIRFDSEYYPNKNHGISGGKTRYHLFDRISRYIIEKL